MKIIKQLFCKHKDSCTLYKNERPTKDLKYIERYEVRVCVKCKKRFISSEGKNYYKVIK